MSKVDKQTVMTDERKEHMAKMRAALAKKKRLALESGEEPVKKKQVAKRSAPTMPVVSDSEPEQEESEDEVIPEEPTTPSVTN